jgi:hypothetical protein
MPKLQAKSAQVLKPLQRQGRSYVRGDRIEVTPAEALALRRQGFVTLTRGVTIEKPAPPRRQPRRGATRAATARNTYERKDMVAEPVDE